MRLASTATLSSSPDVVELGAEATCDESGRAIFEIESNVVVVAAFLRRLST